MFATRLMNRILGAYGSIEQIDRSARRCWLMNLLTLLLHACHFFCGQSILADSASVYLNWLAMLCRILQKKHLRILETGCMVVTGDSFSFIVVRWINLYVASVPVRLILGKSPASCLMQRRPSGHPFRMEVVLTCSWCLMPMQLQCVRLPGINKTLAAANDSENDRTWWLQFTCEETMQPLSMLGSGSNLVLSSLPHSFHVYTASKARGDSMKKNRRENLLSGLSVTCIKMYASIFVCWNLARLVRYYNHLYLWSFHSILKMLVTYCYMSLVSYIFLQDLADRRVSRHLGWANGSLHKEPWKSKS